MSAKVLSTVEQSQQPGEHGGRGVFIIFCAPSGTGKSTLITYLMKEHPELNLHFSTTSRPPRGKEKNGVEYFFLSPEEFRRRINDGDFLEYCEVYKNRFYGTLRSQVNSQLAKGENVIGDLDVIGGLHVKKEYGDQALLVFIKPPSINVLKQRLEARGTDNPEIIKERIERAEFEMSKAKEFDYIVVNDNLEQAKSDILRVVKDYLSL